MPALANAIFPQHPPRTKPSASIGCATESRAAQMDHYSQSLDEDKMARVKADMDDVKNVMVDNIEKARARSLDPRASCQTMQQPSSSNCCSCHYWLSNSASFWLPSLPVHAHSLLLPPMLPSRLGGRC